MSNNYNSIEGDEDHLAIKTEPDFFLSNLLQKHGVDMNQSVAIAQDQNVIVKFLREGANVEIDPAEEEEEQFYKMEENNELEKDDIVDHKSD